MPSGGDKVGRILVLGGGGLLGHKVFQALSTRFNDVWCLIRAKRDTDTWARIPLFQSPRVIDGVDASDLDGLDHRLREMRPAVVVNAIGTIKQRAAAADFISCITLNSLLPHRLGRLLGEWGGRVIHFSTDCVFSGNRGMYRESDDSDASDLYGRSKFLGEVATTNSLTLRTSFIGRELHHHQSLLDWFLAQNHQRVKGFRRAKWSGVTSNHLSQLVGDLIAGLPLSGLYQVAGNPISKYELLLMLREVLKLDVTIEPDDSVVNDRTLDGSKFAAAFGYRPPTWESLIREMADDPTPYSTWTGKHGLSR